MRRCCFHDMCDVLEARYFKGYSWRVVGTVVRMPESKARAVEEQALLLLALHLHGWRPGYMAQEELDGVGPPARVVMSGDSRLSLCGRSRSGRRFPLSMPRTPYKARLTARAYNYIRERLQARYMRF